MRKCIKYYSKLLSPLTIKMKHYVWQNLRMLDDYDFSWKWTIVTVCTLGHDGQVTRIQTDWSFWRPRSDRIPEEWVSVCEPERYWYVGDYTWWREEVKGYTRWEVVEVSADGIEWNERIYVTTVDWGYSSYVCVCRGNEEKFKNWDKFHTTQRKRIRKITPKNDTPEEMTIEEIQEELWYKIKIVE